MDWRTTINFKIDTNKLCLVQTFGFFQYYFGYLDKSYAAFMMGQELDELGEFDNEFVENISKFENVLSTLDLV